MRKLTVQNVTVFLWNGYIRGNIMERVVAVEVIVPLDAQGVHAATINMWH